MKSIASFVFLVCYLTGIVQAQVAAVPITPGTVRLSNDAASVATEAVSEGAPAVADSAASVENPSTAANPERAKQRQAILGKLTFDRRPSSILKAWSTPAVTDVDATTTKKDDSATPDVNAQSSAPETPSEEQQQAQAAAAAKQQEAEKLRQEIEQLKQQVDAFQRDVTLAAWDQAERFLLTLEEAERKSVYLRLLQSLVSGPPDQPKTRSGQIIGERNTIRAADVIALAEMCPEEKLQDSQIALLGALANLCEVEGQAAYLFLSTLHDHIKSPTEERKLTDRDAARILFAAGRIEQSREFLPSLAQATKEDDTEALDVLSDVFLRLHQKEQDQALLEDSWQAAQALLASTKTDEALRDKALRRCVHLVPLIREELGDDWLNESFTNEPERGMEILAGIGAASARSMKEQMRNPDERVATLKLQQTAVSSLLQAAPERADAWQSTLHLLAANWLREAKYCVAYDRTTERGASMTRDMYGNYFWTNSTSRSSQPTDMPQPIPSGKVLDCRPADDWLHFLDTGYSAQFSIETARLHLRVKEEAEAFPYIERLAVTHADDARQLVREFLDVWAENHDPNTQNRRTNIYMFSYGFSQRASGIPLTRSRQVRNLDELADWAERIRQLPVSDIDERWISAAFTRVHSAAEVYRLDDMQRIFGDIKQMEPETLSAMLQTMRGNLAGVWRKPEVQQQSQTNRKKKDIEAEVIQGYRSARQLCEEALRDHPESWELCLADAALRHDENDYNAELKNSSRFAEERKLALSGFQNAAAQYAAGVTERRESDYSVETYQFWFNAALGAPDLDQITPDRQPLLSEIPRIREALETLPRGIREKHLAMFANDLFTRMSRVNPAVKFRYVREGLAIVGDHEQAREAKKIYDYYKDLVSEIRLETVLDGTPAVGHESPFGVFVNLRHTKAIERESGGFAKYLQNQNSGAGFYYNYGRPTENYRDKFEQAARDALDEHFEVLSVTFQPETVSSRATAEVGWRTTSYAYLLLKPRGPEIDRVAPLKLDLDFMDTTGHAVLPVESQALSINCRTTEPDLRPLDQLSITQTLDERQADEGKLLLEIKATAQGLVPELDQLLDLKFADFEIVESEDNGVSVSRFDPESGLPVVVSDRLWTLTLTDRATTAKHDRTFMFASAQLPVNEEIWQRYDDADLRAVDQTVMLQERYDEPDNTTAVSAAVVLALILIGGFFWWRLRKPSQAAAVRQKFEMPEQPDAFNVLLLLKSIERNNGLSPESQSELAGSINRIERYYFADQQDAGALDLTDVAQTWIRKAR